MQLTSKSMVTRSPNCLTAEVAGEAVLMSVAGGHYYALDAIGTDIWSRLQTPKTIADLCAELRRQYSAPAQQIEDDVLQLLKRLADAGVLSIAPEAAAFDA